MPFFDFTNLTQAARVILAGGDPYAYPDVYYPLPLYFIFIPFAGLPAPVAQILWTIIELVILVALLRQRAIGVILFMPVVLTLLMGQIVMPMLGLFALLRKNKASGFALGVLALKPQLVLFIAPWQMWQWWRKDRRQIFWFAITLGALALAAFAVQPDWLTRWLAVSGSRARAHLSPSVWGLFAFLPPLIWIALASALTLGIVAWAWRKNNFDLIAIANFLVNPISISYDLTMLTLTVKQLRAWFILVPLSWLCFAINAWRLNEGAFVFTTLAILIFALREQRAARGAS
jgi:hypothetical protein